MLLRKKINWEILILIKYIDFALNIVMTNPTLKNFLYWIIVKFYRMLLESVASRAYFLHLLNPSTLKTLHVQIHMSRSYKSPLE
jgi:hypothetical protein